MSVHWQAPLITAGTVIVTFTLFRLAKSRNFRWKNPFRGPQGFTGETGRPGKDCDPAWKNDTTMKIGVLTDRIQRLEVVRREDQNDTNHNIRMLGEQINRIDGNIRQLHAIIDENMDKLDSSSDKMQTRISRNKGQIGQLGECLEFCSDVNKSLEKQIEDLREEVVRLADITNTMNQNINGHEQQIGIVEDQVKRIQSWLTTLGWDNEVFRGDVATLSKRVNDIEEDTVIHVVPSVPKDRLESVEEGVAELSRRMNKIDEDIMIHITSPSTDEDEYGDEDESR